MKIHVFDADQPSERISGQTWPNLGAKKVQNDFKLVPQNDPKSIQNRIQKQLAILIDFCTVARAKNRRRRTPQEAQDAQSAEVGGMSLGSGGG